MPSSCSARITRTAISPRLATSTRSNIGLSLGIGAFGQDQSGGGRPGADQRLTHIREPEIPLDHHASPTSSRSDRKSTRLNSSHVAISYAVFCLKKKKKHKTHAHVQVKKKTLT